MKLMIAFTLSLFLMVGSGCVCVKTPGVDYQIDVNKVEVGKIKKTGEDCSSYFLFIPTSLRVSKSIKEAANSAYINNVVLVDYKSEWVFFPLVHKHCVVVHGY